jgi:hypothetical protein
MWAVSRQGRFHLACEPTRSSLNIIWSSGLFEGKGVSSSRVSPPGPLSLSSPLTTHSPTHTPTLALSLSRPRTLAAHLEAGAVVDRGRAPGGPAVAHEHRGVARGQLAPHERWRRHERLAAAGGGKGPAGVLAACWAGAAERAAGRGGRGQEHGRPQQGVRFDGRGDASAQVVVQPLCRARRRQGVKARSSSGKRARR